MLWVHPKHMLKLMSKKIFTNLRYLNLWLICKCIIFLIQGPVSDSKENKNSDGDDDQDSKYFFGHPVFLTVSGQLHLEAITG